jgi:hypothetical protein
MSSKHSASALTERPVKARKEVHITSHEGKVDHDNIHLSQSGEDDVTWFSFDNKKAIVVFASPDGSPFAQSRFDVPAGGSTSSGPVTATAQKKNYKYTVIGEFGVNDPVIIIDK